VSEKPDLPSKLLAKMRSNSEKLILKTDVKPYRRTRRKVERVNPPGAKAGNSEGEASDEKAAE